MTTAPPRSHGFDPDSRASRCSVRAARRLREPRTFCRLGGPSSDPVFRISPGNGLINLLLGEHRDLGNRSVVDRSFRIEFVDIWPCAHWGNRPFHISTVPGHGCRAAAQNIEHSTVHSAFRVFASLQRLNWHRTCWPSDVCQPGILCSQIHMLFAKNCETCFNSKLRRSELNNLLEFLISPLIVPCRCLRCGLRKYRMRHLLAAHPAGTAERR